MNNIDNPIYNIGDKVYVADYLNNWHDYGEVIKIIDRRDDDTYDNSPEIYGNFNYLVRTAAGIEYNRCIGFLKLLINCPEYLKNE